MTDLENITKQNPEPEKNGDPHTSVWLASVFLYALMLLIPLAAAKGVRNGAAFYCILLLPGGFVLFHCGAFVALLYRTHLFVYMHPFVFFVTLTTMYMGTREQCLHAR